MRKTFNESTDQNNKLKQGINEKFDSCSIRFKGIIQQINILSFTQPLKLSH